MFLGLRGPLTSRRSPDKFELPFGVAELDVGLKYNSSMDEHLRNEYFSRFEHLTIPEIKSWLSRPTVGGDKRGLEFMLNHKLGELDSATQTEERFKHSEIIQEAKTANMIAREANDISKSAKILAVHSFFIVLVSAIIALIPLFA